jgi:hypothetical protein
MLRVEVLHMLAALFLTVLASVVAPAGEAEVTHVAGEPGDFVRATHVRLEGSSFEIGRELARLARERHGSAAVPAADPEAVRAQRAYFAARSPAHLERMRGAAEVFGVALDDDAFALDSLGYATPFAGCTVVHYPPGTTTDGRGVVARNFDFTTGTFDGRVPRKGDAFACAEPYVLELHPTDAYASVALVAFDLFGVVDGINSEGLTVALLADDELSATGRARPSGPRAGFDVLQVGRFLLDTCKDVTEAEAALRSAQLYYRKIPCHYLVADRHGRAFVWENAVDLAGGHVIESDGTPLVSTNYLQHLHPDPDALPPDRDPLGLFERQRTLRARMAEQDDHSLDEIRANAECVGALGSAPAGRAPNRTLWRAFYFPEERRVEVDFHLGGGGADERRSPVRTFALGSAAR